MLRKIWNPHKSFSFNGETTDLENGKHENQSLDNLIDEDLQKDMNQAPSKLELIRLQTLKFMASSWFGHIYTNIFLGLSIFSCGQYIYQTYLHDDQRVRPSLASSLLLTLLLLFLHTLLTLLTSPALSNSGTH